MARPGDGGSTSSTWSPPPTSTGSWGTSDPTRCARTGTPPRRSGGSPPIPTSRWSRALLDQTRIAGLGNLWVNELAFLTGVSPWTAVGDVDLGRLVERAATALRHSATVEGAYQVTTGLGVRGEQHWVSGRARRPCLRCGTEVQVVPELVNDPANRRTWWCPRCQPGRGPEARRRTGVR